MLPCAPRQAPPSYQTAALTVGAAALFGAGLYALKGTDAVRVGTHACRATTVRLLRSPHTRPPPAPASRRSAGASAACAPTRPLAQQLSSCPAHPVFAQGSEFFAGYLLEQSLSVDNLFVFVLLFGYFKARGLARSRQGPTC